MSRHRDATNGEFSLRNIHRDIDRLFTGEVSGTDRRISEQLRFAACLADHRGSENWGSLVREAIDDIDGLVSERPSSELADRVENLLEPMEEAACAYTIHYAGHAHIDMNWLWDYPETVDTTYRTFETMLDIMDKYPEFRFSQSQASTYAMIAEHSPDLFERVKKRIDTGQWEVTASTWVEGDKNMSSGESQARHLLYADEFVREELGLADGDVRVDFEPDTFGHPNTIPKLLDNADIDFYYLGRSGGTPPDTVETNAYMGVYDNFPELFRWESPDGSSVLVFNGGDLWYNGHVEPANVANILDFEKESGLQDYLIMYGVGDHGGGPTREDVRTIIEMNEWPIFPETICDTVQGYFETVDQAADDLPVIDEELNFFFRGCYSSQSRVKAANRYSESLMTTAEAAAVIASVESDFEYPGNRIADAWRTMLFHQFHDIFPGAGIPETYDYAMGEYQDVKATGTMVRDRALNTLVDGFDYYHEDAPADAYDDQGVPLLVFNPTGRPGVGTVETVIFDYPDGWDLSNVIIEDANGNTLPVQVTLTREEVQGDRLAGTLPEPSRLMHDAIFGPDFAKIAFHVRDVPAYGYEIYRLTEESSPTPEGVSVAYDGATAVIENAHYRVEIDGSAGAVTSLYDKDIDREFVPDDELFGVLTVETEAPHRMSAWIRDQVVETEDLDTGWSVRIAEDGPGRGAIQFTRSYGNTDLAVTIALTDGSQTIDWTVDADWRETGDEDCGVPVLSTSFPTNVDEPRFTYDIPFGSKPRKATGQDVPAQQWADVSDSASGVGVTISNDTTYGHAGDGTELSLTLLRGSYFPDPIPEMGNRRFEISLRTHGGDFTHADAARHGESFNRSPHVQQLIGTLDNTADREREFLAVDADSIAVTALKRAERGDGAIVRLHETDGRSVETSLRTAWSVESAVETDVLERPDNEIELDEDGSVPLSFEPAEFKTVLLTVE